MDYWEECITEAFKDAGITATKEQVKTVASWVEGAHENYGMYYGHDCIPHPLEAKVRKLKQEVKDAEARADRMASDFKNNVAMRHGCDPASVVLEGGGHATVHTR